MGFNYDNGSTNANYYYGIDNFGNINYIYDASGNIVVTYRYDAWGKPISTTGTLASTVGAANPYRYKSYYYDTETGLYYLQSRYYDAGVGRFVNADEPLLLGISGGIYSYNLYTYCESDPINNYDMFGFWIINLSTTAVGFVLEFIILVTLPYILSAFNSTKLVLWARTSKFFNKIYASAVNALSKLIYNAMDSILYYFAGKAANAATKAFTLSRINKFIGGIFQFSIGHAIAWLIDYIDGDGLSGYIRW